MSSLYASQLMLTGAGGQGNGTSLRHEDGALTVRGGGLVVAGRDLADLAGGVSVPPGGANPTLPTPTPLELDIRAKFGIDQRVWSRTLPAFPVQYSDADKTEQRAAGAALKTRLETAAANGDAVQLEARVYRFQVQVSLTGKRNLTIAGAPGGGTLLVTEFISTGGNGSCLQFTNCEGVTVRDLAWDTDPLVYQACGMVTRADPTTLTFDIALLPGHALADPNSNDPWPNHRFKVWDVSGSSPVCLTTGQPSYSAATPLGGGSYRIAVKDASTWAGIAPSLAEDSDVLPYWRAVSLESKNCPNFAVYNYSDGAHLDGTTATGCKDMTLLNIDILCGCPPLAESCTRGTSRMQNVRCLPPAGTSRLVGGMPRQHSLDGGNMVVEDCAFDTHYDDGINLYSAGGAIVASATRGSATMVCAHGSVNPCPVAAGLTLAFYDLGTKCRVFQATVVAFAAPEFNPDPAGNPDAFDTWYRGITTLTTMRFRTTVTLDAAPDVDLTHCITEVVGRYSTASVTVRGCFFRWASAQALLLRAKSALVEGNLFDSNEGQAVDAGAKLSWGEGGFVSNFTVRNNVVRNSPSAAWARNGGAYRGAAITFMNEPVATNTYVASPSMTGMVVEGNVFVRGGGPAIGALQVADLVVRGNTLVSPGADADPSAATVTVPAAIAVDLCLRAAVTDTRADLSDSPSDRLVLSGPGATGTTESGTVFLSSATSRGAGLGVGALAGSGARDVAAGERAMGPGTSATRSVAVGWAAMGDAQGLGANDCVAVGYEALRSGSSSGGGGSNVAVGRGAMRGRVAGRTAGSQCVAVGALALAAGGMRKNVAVGYGALQLSAASSNVAVGHGAMMSNVLGDQNTAVGLAAMSGMAGGQNTAVGCLAMLSGLGSGNVAIGLNTLRSANCSSTVAVGNGVLGTCAGGNNTGLGTSALSSNSTGSNNTGVGRSALSALSTQTNCTGLGYNAQVTDNNQVQLGNSAATTYVYGTVQNRSDARDKAGVRDTLLGLDFINRLRPVDYRWNLRDDYAQTERRVTGVRVTGGSPPDWAPGDGVQVAFVTGGGGETVVDAVVVDGATLHVSLSDASAAALGTEASARLPAWPGAEVEVEVGDVPVVRADDGSMTRTRFHHGLIAQEVQAAAAAMDTEFGGLQWHAHGGTGRDVYTLGYDELVAPLIKAVQQVSARADALGQRVQALEAELAAGRAA